ncbi:PREDICTED: putative leucine-rich repeat-containing protein DDB_G0290503 [Camelina sativa]|uniref:Leucine-rich repeat-containing protein DDB_G0290503 n=1 Tax=Camelina sativa TaxID=90675 RepID=A0ABM1QJB2_CAMSA|nr:PREDICTED: putative leucine-rich repeat-containing protein DDB_G0290503 [Camelina sativa]
MGIDAKETIEILWKILGYSMSMSIKFMRNHPILSGVSMFLLVLYIFLPSLLFFLIYSSPVLACALVYARERLGLRFSSLYSSSESKSCKGEKRCHLKQQRSVRRNARMKVEEWDSQTSEEEKDKVILTSLYNDLLGRTPQFEESPKAIETNLVKEDNENKAIRGEEEESCDLNVEEPMVCSCEIKYEESSNGKEEISNVNEHGISEIERNKRLESLIARRRARRLFRLALDQRSKLQAEETTSPRQKNNHLQITVLRNSLERYGNNSSDARGLQIPGSAPSVMLQGRNPFDIPYDPQEERPNLTGDSFDQEFSLFNNHKDMFFSRHESFCRFAHFSPEHAQCLNSPASSSDISTTRKFLDLDNEYMDHTEHLLPCNGKEATIEKDDKSVESEKTREGEVEMNDETDSNKEEDDDDSSCSEESESELNRLNKAELREAICQSMDNYPGYLVNQTKNSIPTTLPRGLVAPRLEDHNMFYTRKCGNSHSRTFSVASDMQVEVSEIGSPPTTVDWLDDWSNGGESYIYDTNIDREIVRDEESRKRISHQYESRSGIGSKEENNESAETKLETKLDQNCVVDENLITCDNMSLLDRRSHTEDILEHKPSSSSDVSKPTRSVKLEGMLFHTSASLSSITEEPEIILDSIDGDNSENMNYLAEELSDKSPLITRDSSMKNLIDEELVDIQQVVNDDLSVSPKVIELDIIDHQQEDEILNSSIQGEHEVTKSSLDASLDTTYIESFERDVEEEEPNLNNFVEEMTKQQENEVCQSDLKSSPGYVLTELLENEAMGENDQELIKSIDEKVTPIEEVKTHNVLEVSSSHPHTQLIKDYETSESVSDVILLQDQDSNKTPLDKSTNHEISTKGEKFELLKELEVSGGTQNSQDSQLWTQQCGTHSISSQGISPRALEIAQQLEQEDVIVHANIVSQDINKEEFGTVANDLAASENNNEDNQKLYQQVMEKKIELNLESLYHNIGIVAQENDDEEYQKVNGEIQTTKNDNIVLGYS